MPGALFGFKSFSFPSSKKKRTKSKQISEEAGEDANSYVARGIRA
jgi:hypothetical protein